MAKASHKIVGNAPAARNGIAAALADSAFRARIIKAKKGRGSYCRKEARKQARSSYEW